MNWEKYVNLFRNCEVSINQTRLVHMISSESVKDFPNNLPDDLSVSFQESLRNMDEQVKNNYKDGKIILQLGETMGEGISDETEMKPHATIKNDFTKYYIKIYFNSRNNELKGNISSKKIDYDRLLYSQELVMLIAHNDAFMTDSIRFLSLKRPEILKTKGKKLDWDTILSCGGWDELTTHLSEKYVFDFGWKNTTERMIFLKDKLGIDIDLSDDQINFLEVADLKRNIIVHNGGKINQEYINKSPEKDLKMGDFVDVSQKDVDDYYEITEELRLHLFVSISIKFFNKSEKDFKNFFRIS